VKVALLGSRPISLKALDIVLEAIQENGQGWADLSVFLQNLITTHQRELLGGGFLVGSRQKLSRTRSD